MGRINKWSNILRGKQSNCRVTQNLKYLKRTTVKVTKSCPDLETCGMMNYQAAAECLGLPPLSQWEGCKWYLPSFQPITSLRVTFVQVYLIHCLPGDVGHGSVYENIINILHLREKKVLKEFCLFTSLARNIFKSFFLLASQSKIPPSHRSKSQRLCTKENNISTTLFNWIQSTELFAIKKMEKWTLFSAAIFF